MKYSSLIALVAVTLASVAQVSAQEEGEAKPLISQKEYDEMLMWMVNGKYEKVLYKAIRYTESEKTANEPLPYAYMAEAYFRIHQSDDAKLKELYPTALKESMKYALKFVKKDKTSTYVADYAKFFNELRRAFMNDAEMFFSDAKYPKAKTNYKNLMTLDPGDIGATMMYGTVMWLSKAKRDAEEAWAEAKRLLSETGGKGLEEVQLDLLRYAVISTSEMLAAEGNRTAAIEWFTLTESLFPNDREMAAVRKSIER
jgi:tetratricopeptide (TPR) repeat protein